MLVAQLPFISVRPLMLTISLPVYFRLNNRSTLRAKLGPNVYEPRSDAKLPTPLRLNASADSTLDIRFSSDLEMQTLKGDTLKGLDLMVRNLSLSRRAAFPRANE